jgi:Ca2+-binding RTX toxin-like protein
LPGSRPRLLAVAVLAGAITAAAGPAPATAHDPALHSARGHAEEDFVVHTRKEERRLERHTEAVTEADVEAAIAAADTEGAWGPVTNWPVVGIHVALLANGLVLAYDSVGDAATEEFEVHDFTRATVWNPGTGSQTSAMLTGFNIFCSGIAHLIDGTLFAAGGNKNSALDGIRQTHVFNTGSNTWTRTVDMAFERWYPSVTPLNNGEMLITEGGPDTPEVRQTNGTMRSLTNASLGLPLYPWLDVAPDGRAFLSGPSPGMRMLNTAGTGSWTYIGERDTVSRTYGSHALYDIGEILVSGGGNSTSTARVIDLNAATPPSSVTGSMAFGRRQHNLTVLADGSVLATGGNSSGADLVDLNNGVYNAEQWDPETGQWRTLEAEQVTRQYHSIALLLPDGRVLSAGGGICGTCDSVGYLAKNAQVFSPPYLFEDDGSGDLAPRPQITSAPDVVNYASPFSVATPDAASIGKVALVRLGAVTHSVNFEQRYVPVPFAASGGGIVATAPANANIAPPGVYMLFVIGTDGVPSESRMVRIADTAPPASANVSTAGDVISYTGTTGDDSVVVDDPSAGVYTFTQTGISESSSSCTDGGSVITCTDAAGDANWDAVNAQMGVGADSFSAAAVVQGDRFTVTDAGGGATSTLTGSDGNDVLSSTSASTMSGGAGNDTISSGMNADNLSGGTGNDVIDGGAGSDVINGGADNDSLFGGTEGADDINGDGGNDRMDGGPGTQDDNYDGGTGLDRVVYGSLAGFTYTCSAQPVNVVIGAATSDSCADAGRDDETVQSSVESITGSVDEADSFTGTCVPNTFVGSPSTDTTGADGGDTFNGDPTAGCTDTDPVTPGLQGSGDFFGGGEGNDVFNGDGTIDATHGNGFDTVTNGFPYSGQSAQGGASCTQSGTVWAVEVTLDSTANDCDGFGATTENVQNDIDRVVGSNAADSLSGAGALQNLVLFGRLGNDRIVDGPFADFLNGEGGADDVTCSGASGTGGNDTYVFDAADTTKGPTCETLG